MPMKKHTVSVEIARRVAVPIAMSDTPNSTAHVSSIGISLRSRSAAPAPRSRPRPMVTAGQSRSGTFMATSRVGSKAKRTATARSGKRSSVCAISSIRIGQGAAPVVAIGDPPDGVARRLRAGRPRASRQEDPVGRRGRDTEAHHGEPRRAGRCAAGQQRAQAREHQAPASHAPVPGEAEVEPDDEREPAERDLDDRLEGGEVVGAYEAERVRAEHEAQGRVLHSRRQTEAAHAAAADEEAAEIREHEQADEDENRVHGRRLPSRPGCLPVTSRSVGQARCPARPWPAQRRLRRRRRRCRTWGPPRCASTRRRGRWR